MTLPLTGAEALDLADVASMASEMSGRSVTRSTIDDAEWVAEQIAAGIPEHFARFNAAVKPTLADLLGHPTTTLREVLAASLAGT